ncbi:hypothetical protein EON80_14905 [bacterium]|nr:MAG: hypothetical protein EON80_14905 [bacterium]
MISKTFARITTWLLLGTTVFHTYGLVLVLSHIEDHRGIPLFGVDSGLDEMPESRLSMILWRIFWLLAFMAGAYFLAQGFRKFHANAWSIAMTFVCYLTLIRGTYLALPYDYRFSAQWWGSWAFFIYCALTTLVVLASRPAFFRSREIPVNSNL